MDTDPGDREKEVDPTEVRPPPVPRTQPRRNLRAPRRAPVTTNAEAERRKQQQLVAEEERQREGLIEQERSAHMEDGYCKFFFERRSKGLNFVFCLKEREKEGYCMTHYNGTRDAETRKKSEEDKKRERDEKYAEQQSKRQKRDEEMLQKEIARYNASCAKVLGRLAATGRVPAKPKEPEAGEQ